MTLLLASYEWDRHCFRCLLRFLYPTKLDRKFLAIQEKIWNMLYKIHLYIILMKRTNTVTGRRRKVIAGKSSQIQWGYLASHCPSCKCHSPTCYIFGPFVFELNWTFTRTFWTSSGQVIVSRTYKYGFGCTNYARALSILYRPFLSFVCLFLWIRTYKSDLHISSNLYHKVGPFWN